MRVTHGRKVIGVTFSISEAGTIWLLVWLTVLLLAAFAGGVFIGEWRAGRALRRREGRARS